MPLSAASSWITPINCFYVFNHQELFDIAAGDWSIAVSGTVGRFLKLSLLDLSQLRQREVTNTLECAGNGRAFFRPEVAGVQWERGAVGNATFCGPPLSDVLKLARLRKEARHVAFTGTDGFSQASRLFVRSIPLEKALDPNTILAMNMNGRPLSRAHGFPVRALVPGWIGAASVKRVSQIVVLEEEAKGDFMQDAYRLPLDSHAAAAPQRDPSVALTSLPLKSIIAQISAPRTPHWSITISGAAWGGELGISKVEVSTDFGKNWRKARLRRHGAKYAWTFWEYQWTPLRRGQFTIFARATDTAGTTQMETPKWNPRGYLWNGFDRVQIVVE
ncbi:MAG TPA: sulfite oxidase [Candidatus Angelobacter sp.]